MSPHQASAFTIASNMLLNMSNPAAGNIIKNDMIQILGQLIDLAVLQGSGVSNQPQGIDNVSGINTVTAGGALTWALIEDFPYELDVDNAPSVKRAWIMHPRTLHNIRQLTTSNTPLFVGTPQAQPLTNDLAGGGLIGYPVYTTTQIPITGGTGSDASVYFCDWNDVVLANWGGLEIVASSESGSSFQQNQTHIRAIHLVDVMVRHPVSCCLCNDTTS
jgi:HK97 family phage major capsid protein